MVKIPRIKSAGYIRIFYPIALVVLITSLILSVALYFNFTRTASALAQSYTADQLNQIRYNTDLMFENSKYTMLQYYSNPNVINLLNDTDIAQRNLYEMLQQVYSVNINMPYENNIYFYNQAAGKIYYQTSAYDVATFPDQDILQKLKNIQSYKKLYPIPRKMPDDMDFKTGMLPGEEVYSFIYYDGNPALMKNAIIFNISSQWIKKFIDSMNAEFGKEILIADAQGNVMLGNGNYPYMTDISKKEAFSGVFTGGSSSGYSLKTIGGKKYLVSYVSSDVIDWKYIRITPYDAIAESFQKVLLTTLGIVAAVLLFSLLFGLRISNGINLFFKKRFSELEKRYALEKNAGFDRRQQYLRKLVELNEDYDSFFSRLHQYGIPFALNKGFLIVLFQIDTYQAYCRKYTPDDRELFIYGLINIINELAGETDFSHEAIDMGRGFVALVLNDSFTDFQKAAEKIGDLVAKIQGQAQAYLGESFSAVIGSFLEDYSEIPESYAECTDAMNYRIFRGENAVIPVTEVREIQQKDYKVSENGLKIMTEFLLLGKKEEALASYHQLIEAAKNGSYTFLQMTIMQIVFSIKETFEKENSSSGLLKTDDCFRLIQDMSEFTSTACIDARIERFIAKVMAEHERSAKLKDDRLSRRIQEVKLFVEREYSNVDLSPKMIADRFGISPAYFKKLFKDSSNESLGEFITQYRLQKASELLLSTNEPINDIALKCGFNNVNYFYTLFKKKNGITANEYRTLNVDRTIANP